MWNSVQKCSSRNFEGMQGFIRKLLKFTCLPSSREEMYLFDLFYEFWFDFRHFIIVQTQWISLHTTCQVKPHWRIYYIGYSTFYQHLNKRLDKNNILRTGFEPVTYGLLFNLYSPPLYQLSYRRMFTPPKIANTNWCHLRSANLFNVLVDFVCPRGAHLKCHHFDS